MAQIALSSAGASLGSAILPNGLGALGLQVSGAVIGQAIGGIAGRAIDNALFGRDEEGPRIASIPVMESREGAGIPNVFGRMRLGGQVIWTGGLTEIANTSRAGGKGGPRITQFTYTASFAIALCEGEITRIERVWANGEELALGRLTHRVYRGSEDQLPDPVIEAVEGEGCTPAYRGTAYIVFEDLPLEPFGNRLPQLSFEVVRTPPRRDDGPVLADLVTGVNLIPASGEFVYGTEVVTERLFPAIERPENMNNGDGRADMVVSLDQLETDLPRSKAIALTVGWFGDDLRAGQCAIRPGVEQRERFNRPYNWRAGGVGRGGAWLITRDENDAPNYGGTPADRAVIEGIRDMVARGMAVTISPFLFMDIAVGNGLPDPLGGIEQPPFPWRGRITGSDGTAAVRDEINAFLGQAAADDFRIDGLSVDFLGDPEDWGFRRFILHHAWLARAAGGIEAFLLGSEMRGVSRLRDEAGRFPFVEGLVALAGDVRSILGPDVKISYAADWTEYGAYAPGDGSNDVLFPLDPLWVHPDIDFIGVDWYAPLGDWRDGEDHLDFIAGFTAADDPAYLRQQITGGEAYDWFYASDADRLLQNRTPIIDTAHGEDWVFRQKDLEGWWAAVHHERPGGVRAATSTGWVPRSKPVRLSEIGFPAVDKGGNSPNLFFDPGSSESALPPFSTGARDDVYQRRALEATLTYWAASDAVEETHVWAWDARPWPDFPLRDEVWSDGANWTVGHWLNGRAGLSLLRDVVADIAVRGGIEVDVEGLSGIVEGFALSGVSTLRRAFEPLVAAHDLDVLEAGGAITFRLRAGPSNVARFVPAHDFAGDGLVQSRSLLDKLPGRLRLAFISAETAYQPAVVDARNPAGDRGVSVDVSLPVVMGETRAEAVAERLLAEAGESLSATLAVALPYLDLEPGDIINLESSTATWRVRDIAERDQRVLTLEPSAFALPMIRTGTEPGLRRAAVAEVEPEVVIIDGPPLPGKIEDVRPFVAAAGTPWPGGVTVLAGIEAAGLTERTQLGARAGIGALLTPLSLGPVGRWDMANAPLVRISGERLASVSELAVLGGANLLLIGSASGWELVAFQTAELVGEDTYRLHRLLRGLQGTVPQSLQANATVVLVDERLGRGAFDVSDIGLTFDVQAEAMGLRSAQGAYTHAANAGLAWAPAHLRAADTGGEKRLTWVRRGPDIPDSWTVPDAPNQGRFQVDYFHEGQLVHHETIESPATRFSEPVDYVEVREIGRDGRLGAPAKLHI